MRLVGLVGVLACAGLVVISGCATNKKLRTPDLVERNAIYTIEDGRIVRITAYRGQLPVLGQCVEANTYALASGSCVVPPDPPEVIEPALLDKQGFRSAARLISVETQVGVEASGQKVDSKVSVVRHRLFIEWNRYRVVSLDPYEVRSPTPPKAYVSAVEYGIGIRIILDVSLTNVDAGTNLSFGFGQVAANVATGNAQVDVQYDTIGVPRDILPDDLPVSIESVNDITRMMGGLHQAIRLISTEWNDRVKASGALPIPVVQDESHAGGSTQPDGTGATVESGKREELEIKQLVGDVGTVRELLSKRDTEFKPLLDNDGKPIIGGPNFDALAAKVEQEQELSEEDMQHFVSSIERHAEALARHKDIEARLSSAPAGLSSVDALKKTIAAFYAAHPGNDPALFPDGFTAAPIAYYVTRTDENIQRDYCESLRLNYAVRREHVDAPAKAACAEYWMAHYQVQDLEQSYCIRKMMIYSQLPWLPPKRLRERCKQWNESKPVENPPPPKPGSPTSSKG